MKRKTTLHDGQKDKINTWHHNSLINSVHLRKSVKSPLSSHLLVNLLILRVGQGRSQTSKTPGWSCELNPQAIIQTRGWNCSKPLLTRYEYNRLVTPQYQVVGKTTVTVKRGWPRPPDGDNSWWGERVVWTLSTRCLSLYRLHAFTSLVAVELHDAPNRSCSEGWS